jgi:hypothetical protein
MSGCYAEKQLQTPGTAKTNYHVLLTVTRIFSSLYTSHTLVLGLVGNGIPGGITAIDGG